LPFGKVPADLSQDILNSAKEEKQDQGSQFPAPPSLEEYSKNMTKIKNIVTNSYEVNSKILETKVNAYLINFIPDIPADNVIMRRKILFGDSKKDVKRNSKLLHETFGHCEFDNTILYCMGLSPKQSFQLSIQKTKEILQEEEEMKKKKKSQK